MPILEHLYQYRPFSIPILFFSPPIMKGLTAYTSNNFVYLKIPSILVSWESLMQETACCVLNIELHFARGAILNLYTAFLPGFDYQGGVQNWHFLKYTTFCPGFDYSKGGGVQNWNFLKYTAVCPGFDYSKGEGCKIDIFWNTQPSAQVLTTPRGRGAKWTISELHCRLQNLHF